jgi:NAD(P)H-quinone oxidoreductase subunit 5
MLLAIAYDSTDIGSLLAAARSGAPVAPDLPIGLATSLLVAAALLKSAQFPVHGWLPEVMETPTPVSALLHAGVINAGGFLMIRLADVMLLSPGAMHALAIVGGFSALFGSVVMLTQNSVKSALAWSTIAQMGFMLLQCGLGAFALAFLHLIAHALYKAHAFLSSGTLEPRLTYMTPQADRQQAATHDRMSTALMLLTALLAALGTACLSQQGDVAITLTFAAIFAMGLILALLQAVKAGSAQAPIGPLLLAGSVLAISYVASHAAAAGLMRSLLPVPAALSSTGSIILALTLLAFGLVSILQIANPPRPLRAFSHTLRVHLANGLYANAVFNRLFHATARTRPNL